MKVKVIKADVVSGTSQKTGEFYESTKVVVIFGDGQTGYQGYVPSDVAQPGTIEKGAIYDMYRDDKGYILVFDPVSKPAAPATNVAAHDSASTPNSH